METIRIVLLHFGIALAMAAAFCAWSAAGKIAAKIRVRRKQEACRRRTREAVYWRTLVALYAATDD